MSKNLLFRELYKRYNFEIQLIIPFHLFSIKKETVSILYGQLTNEK